MHNKMFFFGLLLSYFSFLIIQDQKNEFKYDTFVLLYLTKKMMVMILQKKNKS